MGKFDSVEPRRTDRLKQLEQRAKSYSGPKLGKAALGSYQTK